MRHTLLFAGVLLLAACKPPAGEPAAPAAEPKQAEAAAAADATPAAADPAATAEPVAPPDENSPITFESELEFIKDVFKIKTHGAGAGPSLLVVSASRAGKPLGAPAQQLLDSTVATAFASDLNGDQAAEILVFTRSGGFAGFAFNAERFTPMSLPALEGAQGEKYEGGDQFGIEGSKLVRRFPLAGGGTRTITYVLGPAYAFTVESSADS